MFAPGYYITAELRVKDSARLQEAKAALADLCENTMTEPGCTLFLLHQDAADPLRFVLWERFEDEAAFKQHFVEPHTQDYVARDLTEIVRYFQTDVVAISG